MSQMMELYKAAQTLTDQKLQAFQNDILNVRNKSDQLVQRHESFLQKQRDLAYRHGGTHVHGSDMIKLNVGGTILRVLRETLSLVQGSRLEVMFSGRWENKLLRDNEGCVFMDVDHRYFEKIIEYLYSIKVHRQKQNTRSQNKLQDLPKFDDNNEQKVFDSYVKFYLLDEEGDKGGLSYFSPVQEKSANLKDKGTISYKDIFITFKNEEEELKKAEKRLEKIENNLGMECDFISFFTTDDDNEGKHQNDDSDDDISFVTTSSNGSMKSVMKDYQIINLWVSGKVIQVKRSTICRYEGSQLAQNFNDIDWLKEHSVQCEDGTVLIKIDYPSTALSLIINRLRLLTIMAASGAGKVEMPYTNVNNTQDFIDLKNLVSKLFVGKEDLFSLGSWANADSKIIASSMTYQDQIQTWLAEVNKTSEPQLLYRASRDGFKISDFHSKCDDKGATMTIVKTSEGYIFGGYSDKSWDSNSGNKSSDKAFMFSLNSHMGILRKKMKVKSGKNGKALHCHPKYGPTFGDGHDLCVGYYNRDLKSGFTKLDYSYELPSGGSNTFLTGKNGFFDLFEVAEVEIFKV